MTKPKICQWDECDLEVSNYPNSKIKRRFCSSHAVSFALQEVRHENVKMKVDLDKVRQEKKNNTPKERFYHTQAWINFSHYVLLHYADENLEVVCSTDPTLWYAINNPKVCVGHYIKVFDTNSTNYSTAFEFRNVGPQSIKENNNGGNMSEMARWIENTHGHGTIEELKQLKRNAFKLDKYTLEEISKKYLALFNEELKRRNIKNPWR